MAFFLRAKHWQLFLLFFGIPFLLQLILLVCLIKRQGLPSISGGYGIFPVIMLLMVGTLFGWIWAVGTGLQKLIPATIKMKVIKFKIFFFIPSAYLILICVFVGFLLSNMNYALDFGPLFIFTIIFPIHIFSMFCIFYCIYFVAKTIKTVELQRPVTFGEFAGEFLMIWFFMIGVWILQPRINNLVNNTALDTSTATQSSS